MNEQFFIQDPRSLFYSWEIIPSASMTDAEKYNALVRLLLIVVLILFIVGVVFWWQILVIGLILIIVLWYLSSQQGQNVQVNVKRENLRDQKERPIEKELAKFRIFKDNRTEKVNEILKRRKKEIGNNIKFKLRPRNRN
jgi:hypothetical protein